VAAHLGATAMCATTRPKVHFWWILYPARFPRIPGPRPILLGFYPVDVCLSHMPSKRFCALIRLPAHRQRTAQPAGGGDGGEARGTGSFALQLVPQAHRQHRAGRADRMPARERAAAAVDARTS
jgi:hypothetical protein